MLATVKEDQDYGFMNYQFDHKALFTALSRDEYLGIYWKDEERRFVGANRTFLHYYGTNYDQLIGRTEEEMGWLKKDDDIAQDEEKVLKKGVSVNGEIRERFVGGKVRTITVSKVPMKDGKKIIGLVGWFSDISKLQDEMTGFRAEAMTDALTGLYNRRGFDAATENFLRGPVEKAVFVGLDVNNFKLFNDIYGHDTGDVVLKTIASKLSTFAEERGGIAARNGGDEYQCILPLTSSLFGDLRNFAERAFSIMWDGKNCTCLVSMGCALYPLQGNNLPDLARKADKAMYHAKQDKKNHFAIYTDKMDEEKRDQLGFSIRDIVDGIPCPLVIYGADHVGSLYLVNREMGKLIGTERQEEIREMSIRDLVHPDDLQHLEEVLMDQLAHGNAADPSVFSLTCRVKNSTGSWREARHVGKLVENELFGKVLFATIHPL